MKRFGIPVVGRILGPALGLFILWLSLSGHYTVLLVGLGAGCATGVCVLAYRLGILAPDGGSLRYLLRFIAYVPWLVKETVVSGVAVAGAIWHPRLPIRPRVIRTTASQRTPLGLATFANSITLTPGTMSMDADTPGEIRVHALLDAAAEGLQAGEMDRRVRALEGASAGAPSGDGDGAP